jgi:predicted nucleic acid-binding protein
MLNPMAAYLLDTNLLILSLRGDLTIIGLVAELSAQDGIYISVVTSLELFAGMRPREEADTKALLNSLISLPVDAAIAEQAGRWIYQYARQGVQLSFPDALIAATALVEELTLVTTNRRHFPMPELTVRSV